MGRNRYKIYEEEFPYFLTSSVINWIPIFNTRSISKIILNAFKFMQEERGVTLFAYIIMPDHIHFIALGENLSEKVRLFKSYTARSAIDFLKNHNREGFLRMLKEAKLKGHKHSNSQFWQEGFHPQQIVGDKMMLQKIEYIHNNPVKKGYVKSQNEWRYSSIHNYLGNEAEIPITLYQR